MMMSGEIDLPFKQKEQKIRRRYFIDDQTSIQLESIRKPMLMLGQMNQSVEETPMAIAIMNKAKDRTGGKKFVKGQSSDQMRLEAPRGSEQQKESSEDSSGVKL
jgi:hypothetical protein